MSASMRSAPGASTNGMPGESRWGVILRGVVAILFGLIILAWPAISLHALILVFGIFALAAGVFAILGGLRAEETRRKWLLLAEGVVAALAGIVALAWPAITARALLYIIAAWAIATGVIEMTGAFRTRLAAMPEWVLMASGIISVVFGILLLVWPHLGLLALIWLIGIYAIVYGIIHLVLAFAGGPTKKAAAA